MNKSITVKGKGVTFRLFQKDIRIDEIHTRIEGEESWIVIGYEDLQSAITKAEKKFNPKGLRICPECGRKHNETQYNAFCCDACWTGY